MDGSFSLCVCTECDGVPPSLLCRRESRYRRRVFMCVTEMRVDRLEAFEFLHGQVFKNQNLFTLMVRAVGVHHQDDHETSHVLRAEDPKVRRIGIPERYLRVVGMTPVSLTSLSARSISTR